MAWSHLLLIFLITSLKTTISEWWIPLIQEAKALSLDYKTGTVRDYASKFHTSQILTWREKFKILQGFMIDKLKTNHKMDLNISKVIKD